MSLDSMESEIAGLRSQAAALADDYARTQHEVSSDPNLTEAGKKDALAPLHEDMKTRLADLRQQEKTVVQTKREALERSLYGTTGSSTDIVSFRDAQSIAARITDSDEAHTTYTNALRSDDKVLARAVFQQAVTRGWDKITNDYCQRTPSAATALKDLESIRRYEQNTLGATLHYMSPGLSTTRSVAPPAISGGEMAAFFSGGGQR